MPDRRDRSSVCGSCNGRPSPRLVPPATSSSGSSAASAMPTASRNSERSAGTKRVISYNSQSVMATRGEATSLRQCAFPSRLLRRLRAPRNGNMEINMEMKRGSEPRQIGVRQAAGTDVQTAEFGAAMELRKHLAGIEQPVRIEGAFEALLLVEIDFVEHRSHQVALLDPDAVLAGQHATDGDAQFQDVGAEHLGALDLARLVRVVENERMEIAVAGVEHVGNGEPVALRQRADAGEDLRQTGARDRPVHAVVIGGDSPDRRKGGLAPRPEGQPLGLVAALPHDHGAVVARNLLDLSGEMVDLGRSAVQLDDQ